ncbi:hypothetical protein PACTADRAFT_3795 [Pachysolen tannophilus NRRL Y-2460]|uniref:cystathionine gamma-lyase n=1 Tax=Pachysolen tannophilus NRRL Y-2460 TaxID=669874 RepID=A0A1E4TT46_PACTA|nr:hypothetical protein PACTADRAFT_3795 [Pachysolen tannophilus NRRL Y-2460]
MFKRFITISEKSNQLRRTGSLNQITRHARLFSSTICKLDDVNEISKNSGFGTRAVHAGSHPDPVTGAVIAPISLSTTFAQTAPSKPIGIYEYSRSSNPNRDNFEKCIASLENAKYGLAFASGSATIGTIVHSLNVGDEIISVADVYGGTHRYFTKVANNTGIKTFFSNNIENELINLLNKNTKLIWIETPSNPTLTLTDIEKVSQIIKNFKKSNNITHDIKLVVDNTFLSPYIQNPLDQGADIVIHSVTKYINGHSDVVMGVLATNSDKYYQELKFLQNATGSVPSPFDSWLAHRGVKTLHLRVKRASDSALAIAKYLSQSPYVSKVSYPALSSGPQHDIFVKQHNHQLGGGMISFRIKGGLKAANKFVSNTNIFALAESLGGIESLLEVPASMTHSGISIEEREKSGVFDDLVRLSVGIEDQEDLIKDIEQALKIATTN